MILVTAANGNQGKLLIPRLLTAGHVLRVCVRSDASAQALRSAGVTDVVVGDITDPDLLARAMKGVQKVYHVGPALHPEEKEMGFAVIDAACAAGVEHFVFSSVLHSIITDLIQHEIKRDIEEYLLSAGIEFTILQPSNFMLPMRLKPVFEEGVFRLSWALDRYQSMVDLGDVTEVAAAVLANSDHHAAATYELVAPGRYTAHDLARITSGVLGRQITVERIEPTIFLKRFLGVDDLSQFPYQARVSGAISTRYSDHDFVGNPNVLTWLLGRQPTTWEQFVQKQFDIFQANSSIPAPT